MIFKQYFYFIALSSTALNFTSILPSAEESDSSLPRMEIMHESIAEIPEESKNASPYSEELNEPSGMFSQEGTQLDPSPYESEKTFYSQPEEGDIGPEELTQFAEEQ